MTKRTPDKPVALVEKYVLSQAFRLRVCSLYLLRARRKQSVVFVAYNFLFLKHRKQGLQCALTRAHDATTP